MIAPEIAGLLDLRNRVVLVTGASGGIGAGIVRRVHAAGARVAVHFATHGDEARALVASLGATACAVSGDVERDAVRICADVTATFGQLDALVNNAALQPAGALLDLSADDVSEMLRVNVAGVAAMTNAIAHHVIARDAGAAIVNIASIEGIQPAVGHSHYAASKAAVLMHTRAAALELGAHGIRVNAIAPGLIDRDGLEQAWPSGVKRWLDACPLERLGSAEDVANATLFLLSDAAQWITGATLTVDGGMLARSTW